MRIISGKYKSRKLITPSDNNVRPTGDRAKETLFNILSSRFELEGTVCLDLFCGTGNLGLECISRGADKCFFVDKDISIVKKNIDNLEAEGKCEIFRMDAIKFLEVNSGKNIDFVFSDPPYSYENYNSLLDIISGLKTVFILEHPENFRHENKFDSRVLIRKKIGTINFTIFDFR